MAQRSSVDQLARAFATELKSLLNRTVCDGAHIGVLSLGDGRAGIGTGLGRCAPVGPVRLRARGRVPLWLTVACRLFADPDGYLTVESSTYTLLADDPPEELLHYDYQRSKPGYPDAHLQIRADGPVWARVLAESGRDGGLHRLHLPVGGRRYRPSLEDVIEALIVEGLVVPRCSDWREILSAGRDGFRRSQLGAAVRQDPDAAANVLRSMGYRVTAPEPEPERVISLRGRGRRRRP